MLTKNNSSMGFIFYCCDPDNIHFGINNTINKIREHQKNRRTKNELKIWGNPTSPGTVYSTSIISASAFLSDNS